MRMKSYDLLKEKIQKIADINGTMAVLAWDKETYLPAKANGLRSRQLATLSSISHEEYVSEETGELLEKSSRQRGLDIKAKKNIKVLTEDYLKSKKLPTSFIVERSMAESEAYHQWVLAKKDNRFGLFAPALDKLIVLKRREAEMLNEGKGLYNTLLDQFEPGSTTTLLDKLFTDVRKKLLPIIHEISEAKQVKSGFLQKKYNKDKQFDFGIYLLNAIGYDFDHGRQDISPHPFTIGFSPADVRITTRIDENDFSNMTWSTLHEAGHALYEQGLNPDEYGLPCGGAASLAIHESQSRLWENHVGRSMDFWQAHYPSLQKTFKPLKKVSIINFYKAINKVEPSFIRTESDELHYHIHVLIRYEIEKALIEDGLDAEGARALWNEKYQKYLGLKIKNDAQGILQDVHWSHGSFGYFPTYSMGSFYAAQFFEQANTELPKLKEQIAKGNTFDLLKWLRENIHQHGRLYEAQQLCKRVTGKGLSLDPFVAYAKEKYSDIYGIDFQI